MGETFKTLGICYCQSIIEEENFGILETVQEERVRREKNENIEGSWNVADNSCYVHITYDDKEYSGVFCKMQDEAGTDVMTFTAAGSNESIWGVKY